MYIVVAATAHPPRKAYVRDIGGCNELSDRTAIINEVVLEMPQNPRFRRLGVKSSHRQAMLRNLVSSLIEHESISTTYARAKEAQSIAERMITLAKKGTPTAQASAAKHLFSTGITLKKLFGPLASRYQDRPGGYTRVLRMEPRVFDKAPAAILELVDGPKDMRFAMTARILARCSLEKKNINEITQRNIEKVVKFRKNGKEQLDATVERLKGQFETLHPSKEPQREFKDLPYTKGMNNRFRLGRMKKQDEL